MPFQTITITPAPSSTIDVSGEMQGLPPTPQEQGFASVIKRVLEGEPFGHGDSAHPKWVNGAEVSVRTARQRMGAEKNDGSSSITISIADPHVQTAGEELEAFVLQRLKSPALGLSEFIDFETDRAHKESLKKELLALATESKSLTQPIAAELVEKWPGLDADIKGFGVEKDALSVTKSDAGIKAEINVPKGGAVSASQVADNLRARLAPVKEALKTELSSQAGTDAQKKLIAQQIDAMEITVAQEQQDFADTVTVRLRSKAQADVARQPGGMQIDQKAFRDSNPLSAIPDGEENPLLQNMLKNALLHSGQKDQHILASVLGWKDVQTYLNDGLTKLASAKPELKTRIDAVMKDPLLARADWMDAPDKQPEGKGGFSIATDDKLRGVMHVTLHLPPSVKAADVLQKVAALNGGVAPHTAPAPAASPKFAQVDSIQLVGATTKPALEEAKRLMQEFKSRSASDIEERIEPLAQKLVGLVKEANRTIEEATKIAAGQVLKQESLAIPATTVQVHQLQPGHMPPALTV